ncbi:MAG TPA: hypothetical protein ENI85_11025 [Deltaproteobacteria bacterium]|nr:hypothetical protein [Deltaproteobacteria bacterium]
MSARRSGWLRLGFASFVLAGGLSCASLNYPDPAPPLSGHGQGLPPDADAPFGIREDPPAPAAGTTERPLSWSDLTRLAREHRQRGELTQARERLAQAAMQLKDLPPTNAQRRTVFGLQARLAERLLEGGDPEDADRFADELLAEAEAEPELGGAALVSLALSVAERRAARAAGSGAPYSPLPLLRIAFETARTGPASRDRIGLSFRVADEAYRADELALARRAIDQALADTRRLRPTDKQKIAAFEIYRSRIALAQGDLDTAETSAVRANQIFDEVDADSSNRGIAEASLAEVLARKGDLDRASVIIRGARARLDAGDPIHDHARRLILAAVARVERIAGNPGAARKAYAEALAIPPVDFAPDADLVRRLRHESGELEKQPDAVASPPTTDSPALR